MQPATGKVFERDSAYFPLAAIYEERSRGKDGERGTCATWKGRERFRAAPLGSYRQLFGKTFIDAGQIAKFGLP